MHDSVAGSALRSVSSHLTDGEPPLDSVVDYIGLRYRVDLRQYRPRFLDRRISSRMQARQAAEPQAHVRALLRRRTIVAQPVLPPPKVGKTIAFFSLRGGVGVSSLSSNIVVALSGLWSKPTALVDLALTCGHSALALNQTLRHTWADLASILTDECPIELVEQAMLDHESGVRTPTAPPSSETAVQVTAATVDRVLELLSSRYECIVLDLPPDIASVYAARRALGTFRMLDYPAERVS